MRKYHSCSDLLLHTSLSGAGKEPGPLGFTADTGPPSSALRFGSRALRRRQSTEAGAGALSFTSLQGDSSSPSACFSGLFGLVLLSTAAFSSPTKTEFVYRKVILRSSQDLLSFFQTWYADKPYPIEIKVNLGILKKILENAKNNHWTIAFESRLFFCEHHQCVVTVD